MLNEVENKIFEIDYSGVGANVAQIQVLAAVIKEMLIRNEMPADLDAFVNLPIPKAFASWEELFDLSQKHSSCFVFRIVSEVLPSEIYFVHEDCGLLDYSIYRSQALLQKKLNQLLVVNLDNMSGVDVVRFSDSLKGIYISLCVELGQFIMNHFFDDYDPRFNFRPIVPDIEWLRRLTGIAGFYAELKNGTQKKQFEKVYKVELLELTTQCRYLSFWICLLQFIYSPSLPKEISQGFSMFAFCLLQKHNAVYVHHVLVEIDALKMDKKAKKRGPKDNTTRIKVYFTFEDGKPLVVRFDLPHKGMNSLHLNIKDYHHNSQPFDHYRFALGSFEDDLLESLQQALLTFDYNGSLFLHAGPDSDHLYLQRVSLERAVFALCGIVFTNKVLTDKLKLVSREPTLNEFFDSTTLSKECMEFLKDNYEVLNSHYKSKSIDPSGWTISQLFDHAVKDLWSF